MAIVKVIEVMSNSTVSWEEATRNAVKEASKSVKNIKGVNVSNMSCTTDGSNVLEFRVNVKISFLVNT